MDMAAIAANPDHFPAPFEHKAFLNILHKALPPYPICRTEKQSV